MKQTKAIERSDLAQQSWQILPDFYREYSNMLTLIKYVKENSLDDILHASTSHQLLNISPRHRHDAKVYRIRIGDSGSSISIELFDPSGNLEMHENRTPEDFLDRIKKHVDIQIEEYQLRVR